ncbi:unnamed protein product [Adineta ricciae]|uniref:Uncharacterized protein n=1 Tax=Adineta ricciae TaxID=249248 RepID=A0A815IZV0_ADIRI|nr:unnamed protein product [Adineta ricciae]
MITISINICFILIFLFSLSFYEVNSTLCSDISQYGRCSTNSACGCFPMSGADNVGICGFLWTSCSTLDLCDSVTNACAKDEHICIHHPRCHVKPVCYPASMISSRVCPPLASKMN